MTYLAAIRLADTARRRKARAWLARAAVIRAQLIAMRTTAW